VADFVGIANFVPATVRSVDPDTIALDTPIGLLVARNAGGLTLGQCVTVVLRPTALRLCATPQQGRAQAALRSSSFLGELRRHHLQLGELSLVVDQLPEESGEVPDEPWLAVNPAVGFHILPSLT
jgi:ABC-type Fe3+/spermidine/putrescine transport system ATPase subunit